MLWRINWMWRVVIRNGLGYMTLVAYQFLCCRNAFATLPLASLLLHPRSNFPASPTLYVPSKLPNSIYIGIGHPIPFKLVILTNYDFVSAAFYLFLFFIRSSLKPQFKISSKKSPVLPLSLDWKSKSTLYNSIRSRIQLKKYIAKRCARLTAYPYFLKERWNWPSAFYTLQ